MSGPFCPAETNVFEHFFQKPVKVYKIESAAFKTLTDIIRTQNPENVKNFSDQKYWPFFDVLVP